MLRRFIPYLLVVLIVLIDISVVPVFTSSVYVVPISLIFTMCTGFLLGRSHGVLCGLAGGLLLDILASTPLGYMMVTYTACGYLAGLAGYDSDEARARDGYSRVKALFRRTVAAFVIMGLFEAITMIYQYFNTARFEWIYVKNALARMALCAALADALYYLAMPVMVGRATARVMVGMRREVKNL